MPLRRAGEGGGQGAPSGWAGSPSSSSWPEVLPLLLLLPKLGEVRVRTVRSFHCPGETEEACALCVGPPPLQFIPTQQVPAGLSLVPSLGWRSHPRNMEPPGVREGPEQREMPVHGVLGLVDP